MRCLCKSTLIRCISGLEDIRAGDVSIVPALGNQFVYMLKMSSLVSVIGMQELTRKANELVVTEYRPLEIYTILVLEYLVLILVVSGFFRWLESRMQSDES